MAKVVTPVAQATVTPEERNMTDLERLNAVVSNMRSALMQTRERGKQTAGTVTALVALVATLQASNAALTKRIGVLAFRLDTMKDTAHKDEWNTALASLRSKDGIEGRRERSEVLAEMERLASEAKAPMAPAEEQDLPF